MRNYNEERVSIRKDYNTEFYVLLLKHAQRALEGLAETEENSRIEEKIDWLKRLGIRRIFHGRKLRFRDAPPYAFHRALLRMQKQISRYLERHRESYEGDLGEGKLEGICAPQLEFVFGDYIRRNEVLENEIPREHVASFMRKR